MSEEQLPTVIYAYNDDPATEETRYQTFMNAGSDFAEKMIPRFEEVGRDYDELVRQADIPDFLWEMMDEWKNEEMSREHLEAVSNFIHTVKADLEKKSAEGGDSE